MELKIIKVTLENEDLCRVEIWGQGEDLFSTLAGAFFLAVCGSKCYGKLLFCFFFPLSPLQIKSGVFKFYGKKLLLLTSLSYRGFHCSHCVWHFSLWWTF